MRSSSTFFGATGSFAGRRGLDLAELGIGRLAVGAETMSMPCSTKWRVQVLDLLLRDVDLLEAGRDLLERQEAALAALGDEERRSSSISANGASACSSSRRALGLRSSKLSPHSFVGSLSGSSGTRLQLPPLRTDQCCP